MTASNFAPVTARLCFVGDSFVNGTGDPACLGWAGQICAAASARGHDLTYYNLGVRRETTADIKNRWQQEVACRLPASSEGKLIFSFGVNDTTIEAGGLRVALEDSLRNAEAILKPAAQRYSALMISPPPGGDEPQNQRIAALSQQLAALCAVLQIPYLDVFTPLHNSPVWMQEVTTHDGYHPRRAGYAELAAIVAGWSAWLSWFP